jgi:hypothetical protein
MVLLSWAQYFHAMVVSSLLYADILFFHLLSLVAKCAFLVVYLAHFDINDIYIYIYINGMLLFEKTYTIIFILVFILVLCYLLVTRVIYIKIKNRVKSGNLSLLKNFLKYIYCDELSFSFLIDAFNYCNHIGHVYSFLNLYLNLNLHIDRLSALMELMESTIACNTLMSKGNLNYADNCCYQFGHFLA